jgi:hypothetical protein
MNLKNAPQMPKTRCPVDHHTVTAERCWSATLVSLGEKVRRTAYISSRLVTQESAFLLKDRHGRHDNAA